MGLLEGDAIVLAGATGRVGGATLATLVREGARVVVISRSLDRAVAAIGRYAPAAGDRAFPYEVDLADPASAEAALLSASNASEGSTRWLRSRAVVRTSGR